MPLFKQATPINKSEQNGAYVFDIIGSYYFFDGKMFDKSLHVLC